MAIEILRYADSRSKVRWRAGLAEALGDVGDSVLSSLEHRYVRQVERPHGLPPARRQARIVQEQRVRYVDNLYEAALVAVELDGQVAHAIEDQSLPGCAHDRLRLVIVQRPCPRRVCGLRACDVAARAALLPFSFLRPTRRRNRHSPGA